MYATSGCFSKLSLSHPYPVTRDALAGLSPYLTRTVKRFGEYLVKLDVPPMPLDADMTLSVQEPGAAKVGVPA